MVDVPFSLYGMAVNNVRNPTFGAYGDDSHDDTISIQAAINDSFGTTAAPHGESSWLNKPLYFPHGQYRITSPLTFPHVKGGWIFGDGALVTGIINSTANGSAFVTNGFESCRIERMLVGGAAVGNGSGIDLNWDGTGTVGLKGNSFLGCMFGGGASGGYGVRIAAAGFGGSGNYFETCYMSGGIGIATLTAGAVRNTVVGGNMAQTTIANIRMINGSISLINGVGFQNNGGAYDSSYDIMIDPAVTDMIHISACRSESQQCLWLHGTNSVKVDAYTQTGGNHFLDLATGRAALDSCATLNGTITGSTGRLYIRGGTFPSGYLSGFTGTQVQVI